jgi:LacI family repressor for deo operon, udp, cdd, tsx, nupC, and nupG
MPDKKTTAKDIALKVGVSQQVVSAVLKGNMRKTSAATREKILQTARELNYRPNNIARILRSGKGRFIAVLFASLGDRFFAELLHHIGQKILQHNYITIFSNWTSYDEFDTIIKDVSSCGTAGIITSHEKLDHISPALPIVTYAYRHPKFDSVEISDVKCLCEIFDYLYKLGHRKFAFISGKPTLKRYKAFLERLDKYNLQIIPEWHITATPASFDTGRKGAQAIMSSGKLPTALIAANDVTAIAAMAEFAAAGIRTPEDISIVGCDNIPESENVWPRLTTIDLCIENLAELLTSTMMQRLENPDLPPIRRISESRIVMRNSCAPPCKK